MIYFAQDTAGGPIRIGTTGNVEARLDRLEAHDGRPLALISVRLWTHVARTAGWWPTQRPRMRPGFDESEGQSSS